MVTSSLERLREKKAQEALTTEQKKAQLRDFQEERKLTPTKTVDLGKKTGTLFQSPDSKKGEIDPVTGKAVTRKEIFRQVAKPTVEKEVKQETRIIGGVQHVKNAEGKFVPVGAIGSPTVVKTGSTDTGESTALSLGQKIDQIELDISAKKDERLEEDRTSAEKKIAAQREELGKERQILASTNLGNISAVEGRFSEGLNGLQTSTAAGLEKGVKEGITIRTSQQRAKFAAFETSLREIETEIERAEENREFEKRNESLKKLSDLKEAIRVASEEAAEETDAAQADLQERLEDFESFVSDEIGFDAFAGVSTTLAGDWAERRGLDRSAGIELQALAKDLQAAKNPEDAAGIQGQISKMFGNIAFDELTQQQKNFASLGAINELVSTNKMTEDEATQFKNLLGIGDEVESAKDRASRLKTEAETRVINEELSPSAFQRTIDVENIGTGSSLPLFTLGQGDRTDRHNNPIASKSYAPTLSLLENAGLVKGVDFDLGETTSGIDSDAVSTVMFTSAEAGTRGAIAVLEGGQLSSWYTNDTVVKKAGGDWGMKYGGAKKIQDFMSGLTGLDVNLANSQDVFNEMDEDDQVAVVKEIYKHEGGKQLFKPASQLDYSPLGKLTQEARDLGLSGKKAKEFAEKRLEDMHAKLTEQQGKSLTAFTIMDGESKTYDKITEEVDQEEFARAINKISRLAKDDTFTGEMINRSTKDPKVRQAILSEMRWVEGKLRQESGAAISVEEYTTNGTSHFPRAGDDAETLAQKKAARNRSTRGKWLSMGSSGQRSWEEEFGGRVDEEPVLKTDEEILTESDESEVDSQINNIREDKQPIGLPEQNLGEGQEQQFEPLPEGFIYVINSAGEQGVIPIEEMTSDFTEIFN